MADINRIISDLRVIKESLETNLDIVNELLEEATRHDASVSIMPKGFSEKKEGFIAP